MTSATGIDMIDLAHPFAKAANGVTGLQAMLAQLLGEPFRFARVSYGNELTLHFGDMRPADSVKLKGKSYGAYVLGLRGSPWMLKTGARFIAAGLFPPALVPSQGMQVRKEDLESMPLFESGSRVLEALPFESKPSNSYGLQLRMSDGGSLHVIPPALADAPSGPEDEALPELADWELQSPNGLLCAWPDRKWTFEPIRRSQANANA